ncbi:Hypothetical predicted protein [Xyrichtys novacula]|uniref:Uncharacterized protein n=1 Tax=Xyrichtys novacula TaxID=13765 RepID=A0AAV1HRJ5_XYRNO|nr:Hypothetical predicted protein [Xyrichtys novacula]
MCSSADSVGEQPSLLGEINTQRRLQSRDASTIRKRGEEEEILRPTEAPLVVLLQPEDFGLRPKRDAVIYFSAEKHENHSDIITVRPANPDPDFSKPAS